MQIQELTLAARLMAHLISDSWYRPQVRKQAAIQLAARLNLELVRTVFEYEYHYLQ